MYLLRQEPGNFGAGHVLACKVCDGEMLLTRRSPDPDLGSLYEVQRFTCRKCRREVTRSVDRDGNPPAGERVAPSST